MTDRASVFETIQIGVEATPGTGVAADKKLQSLSIMPGIDAEVQTFRPFGNKYPTVAAIGKEMTKSKVEGEATYTELIYPFSGIFETPAISTPGGATLARQWLWNPSSNAADTRKTFTVEQGSSVRAHKSVYGLFSEFGMEFDRSDIKPSGAMFSQALQDNAAMTGAPTALELIPILPKQVSVYLADTAAGLAGASAMLRALKASWKIGDRFNPLWALNSANSSFAADVEAAPKGEASLLVEADAEGMALLTTLRSGATKFMRIKAVGDEIDVGVNNYLFQIDLALKLTKAKEFKDEDGVLAIEWGFDICHDETFGKALEVTLVNKLTAL